MKNTKGHKMIVRTLLILATLWASNVWAKKETANCTIAIESQAMKLNEEPVKTEIKVKLDSEDGWTGKRHPFDLPNTPLKCEVAFAGSDRGTFINCWKPDLSIGVQSDRSSIKAKGEASKPNFLSVTSDKGGSKISFKCE